MKKYLLIVVLFLFCVPTWSQSLDGTSCRAVPRVKDYDGNIYHSVQIGSQCWMKENLHTLHYADGKDITPVCFPDNNKNTIVSYGVLYNWQPASKNICPQGWHVPTDAEWTQLTDYLSSTPSYSCGGKVNNIAKFLASTDGWLGKTNTCAVCNQPSSNNATGFSAMPAGGRDYGFGDFTRFWSSTSCYGKEAYYRMLSCTEAEVSRSIENVLQFMSIRCIYDDSGISEAISPRLPPETDNEIIEEKDQSVTDSVELMPLKRDQKTNQRLSDECVSVEDYDGNIYPLVMLGSQCWMAENLRVTHYSDGTLIPLAETNLGDKRDYSCRLYPGANVDLVNTYGYLYTWCAALNGNPPSSVSPSGVQGICPDGWHLPSDVEWKQLLDYVGAQPQYQCMGGKGKVNIAKALASQKEWEGSDIPCTVWSDTTNNNTTGFNAMPAGTVFLETSMYFGSASFFMTSTDKGKFDFWHYYLWYKGTDVKRVGNLKGGYLSKYFPMSVRCVRDK